MKLHSLLGPDAARPQSLGGDPDIAGITADSRAVRPGFLFAALAGSKADGARFAADALARGAAAVLAAEGADLALPATVAVVRAADPRRALALVAARFHQRQPDIVVAVTGTNGKTSVADFTRQIFAALGRQAASLGTIGVVKPAGAVYGSLTTPDPVALHAELAELAGEGITHLALEASSHGLDQRRLDGVRLAAGAFTNLGHDHLDYHPTVEDYLKAKIRLFDTLLERGQPAVVNADGPRAADVIAAAEARGLRLITTGRQGRQLRLDDVVRDGFCQRITVSHGGRSRTLRLDLIGDYQASNGLVAAGLAIACGERVDLALDALETIRGVRGRLEVAGRRNGGIVCIDYAHKPEALAAALDALRPFATGRLVCLFGCGGDRDRLKRPVMGRIAVEKSDVVIITDDNPRSEAPAAIRAEILAGARITPGAVCKVREIGSRAEAIATGVGMLEAGDVLLVAGKGHETGQIVGGVTHPFSDHEAVAEALGGEAC